MGAFNEDKKTYCGKYKGVHVYQYGCMIGNGWYGEFYAATARGKSGRIMKVRGSTRKSLDELKEYIDKHFVNGERVGK